ncbi:hypothetical protein [Acaryochloris sp. IP29b_bin.148]|uniref:hypothetical protein n=1 Tax=Acaryochloris sp. IP29b_bin.148 TaxID=2969218 RepID=UPI002609302B|nr:hypothetical protein [Acaryochloris sp. IP29b_bin.148]
MQPNAFSQTPVLDSVNAPDQALISAIDTQADLSSTVFPYVTPMVQYYLEREAEWARD